MMNLFAKIILLPFILSAVACSTNPDRQSADDSALPRSGQTGEPLIAPAPRPPEDLSYTVEPGDILSGIAKKTTANGDNWHKIALYNGIENPSDIRVGDTIMIPGDMLRPSMRVDSTEPAHETVSVENAEHGTSDPESEPADAEDVSNDASLLAQIELPQAQDFPDGKPADTELPATVIVEGSYYPKAIYDKPKYTGVLLLRVSPGTTLEFVGESDDWVEVRLENGNGFIHRGDVRISGETLSDSARTF